MRSLGLLLLLFMGDRALSQSVEFLGDFPVVEFRRYTLVDNAREPFARYFETYFPEAFQQLGAIAIGQFHERENELHFLWLRGFHNMDDRARINAAFYYGPVWKEHRDTLNGLMTDSDNVLLLRPLGEHHPLILPTVDAVKETATPRGVAVVQIFSVKPNEVDAFARHAEKEFARYREAGVREAAVLTTLDAPNNFPQLPIRTDGPFVVWLGVLQNEEALARFKSLSERSLQTLSATGLLRAAPEQVVLDPTPRSRLRWIP